MSDMKVILQSYHNNLIPLLVKCLNSLKSYLPSVDKKMILNILWKKKER